MTLNAAPAFGAFASTVAQWQKQHGRNNLPWQKDPDPYRIWLSEIMLQQTQVGAVLGYYERFLARFPTLATLASATQDEVMPYWAGLGYYARARNLHRCAQVLVSDWGGRFPRNPDDIARLPGIGRSTAAAIAAFSFGHRSPIMDGNVKRVFTRYFGIYGVTTRRAVETVLWRTAEDALAAAPPGLDMTAYTQGLMDMGATRCTRSRPACGACPLSAACHARIEAVQHELPTPRPRKTIPQRECKMLVLDHDAHILLERQKSPGIWGGLWSLPRFDDISTLETALAGWGHNALGAQKLGRLLHVFSHFSLDIEPWHVQCSGSIAAPHSSRQAWVAIPDLPATALPAPVRKILEGLYPRSGL